jgi:hypothetical protein
MIPPVAPSGGRGGQLTGAPMVPMTVRHVFQLGCALLGCRTMLGRMTAKITRMNPAQLHASPGYHHVTVVEAGRTAFLAGQCPIDASGALVGDGDINAQIDRCPQRCDRACCG